MKYFLITVLVLLLVFFAFMQLEHCPHILRKLTSEILHKEYIPAADITFTPLKMTGHGPGPGGSRYGFSPSMSSDCVRVYQGVYWFPEPGDAQAQLREWVRSAKTIVAASDGKIPHAPERVVVQVAGEKDFTIFFRWGESKNISFISSRSLNHALLFEKQKGFQHVKE